MRLAFWRTEKPVARPVLQPGADSPYVPNKGVWMEAGYTTTFGSWVPDKCHDCGFRDGGFFVYFRDDATGNVGHFSQALCEGCGAKLVAQLRREREG